MLLKGKPKKLRSNDQEKVGVKKGDLSPQVYCWYVWEVNSDHFQRQAVPARRLENSSAKRDTSSVQARVVYAEHCARRGALSKANQAVTSNSMPNADPTNIDLLRAKHPDSTHPDSDPVKLSSILWPRPQVLEEHWSSDAGVEFLDKWFSIPKICPARAHLLR